jgi:2-iminobutanoate/2-iminopropanoate deaminase
MMNSARLLLLLVLVACAGYAQVDVSRPVPDGQAEKRFVRPTEVIGPYTPAVQAGRFLFVSGQIALDPKTGQMVDGDIETETLQVLNNLRTVLRAAGYDSADVVSATVYLTDMNMYTRVNSVYARFFPEGKYPARVAVQVSKLPKQANVEIAVVGYK